MKKNLFLIVFVFTAIHANSKQCSCGTFESGMFTYGVVGEESGCCTGEPTGAGLFGDNAAYTTYEYSEGAWTPKETKLISPTSAQNRCCDTNS